MRTPFFLAYDAENCTHVKLHGKEIDDLVKTRPGGLGEVRDPLSSGLPDHGARPGHHRGDHHFMRKLDVKEIHGYQAALGLELIKPEKLAGKKKARK